jgi:serine/threonine protein kinase
MSATKHRFADELMALGSISGHALVKVVGSGSYGVALLARERPDQEAGLAGAPGPASVIIKVAKRALAPGLDSVWAAHMQEWAALVAVVDVPGAPEAFEMGVLSLAPLDGPRPPGRGGLPVAPPASGAGGAPPQPHPRCHAFMTMAALGPDLWQVMSGLRAAAWKGRVFAPLAEAMLAAVSAPHAAGVVHRDVKPENICMANAAGAGAVAEGRAGARGAKAAVVLIDFGGACVAGRRVRSRDRLFYGTPAYASVASLRGAAPSPWDDLESLGYWCEEGMKGEGKR